MLNDDVIIKVTNRNRGYTGYKIPELNNLQRQFAPTETKQITMGELRKLSWIPGGKNLINSCFVLDNTEAVTELLGDVEPEYYYSDKDIKNLLLHGSLAQLQDCMDFAPEGVTDLIKQYAVELKLNDYSKREAIKNKLGFDVTFAIEAEKAKEEANTAETHVSGRRAAPITAEEVSKKEDTPTRRTAAPQKYKVTSITK